MESSEKGANQPIINLLLINAKYCICQSNCTIGVVRSPVAGYEKC